MSGKCRPGRRTEDLDTAGAVISGRPSFPFEASDRPRAAGGLRHCQGGGYLSADIRAAIEQVDDEINNVSEVEAHRP